MKEQIQKKSSRYRRRVYQTTINKLAQISLKSKNNSNNRMTTKPSAPQSTTIEKRTKPKKACKLKQKITTRDRLLSIIHDSETFVVPTVQRFQRLSYQTSHGDHNNWKVFGNERCGAVSSGVHLNFKLIVCTFWFSSFIFI